MTKRKRGPGGRPATGKNVMIGVRWEPWLLEGIDKYGDQQLLQRHMALRDIVYKFLVSKRIIKPDEVRKQQFPRDVQPNV